MHIVFCGGAGEVGASCYLAEIDGKNILLDCGIRMSRQEDSLPDFSRLQQLGGVDAIVVSHAHLDHTGALPIISREFPEAKIYMTHASKHLTQVLLYDSLKIMERSEAEIPVYVEKHVQEMLQRVVCYSPQYGVSLFTGTDLKLTFLPAGHIAGAAMVYLQGKEGALLYSGDISLSDQLTINGASFSRLRPDVMILESTYGMNLHANRQVEEKRLLTTLSEVLSRKGKMLIPAFALGRAQELLLIIRRGIAKKELPPVNVYVDGMVRSINQVYKLAPNYLRSGLAKQILQGRDIFYDEQVLPVETPEMRKQLLESKDPLCIISSSGMLKGGPSALYAKALATDERNYIALTGYQDEETPGGEVLRLLQSPAEERQLSFDGEAIGLRCGLGTYNLSAHADRGELLNLVHRVGPRRLFLVHGEKNASQRLAAALNQEVRAQIYVPENGDEYPVVIGKKRKQLVRSLDVQSLGRPVSSFDEEAIQEVWQLLFSHSGTDIGYSAEEILYVYSGQTQFNSVAVDMAVQLLNQTSLFQPNRRKLFLYHPVSSEGLTAVHEGPMELNQMIQLIKERFPDEAGLVKVGARVEEQTVLLQFLFPHRAKVVYEKIIQSIAPDTGWQVAVNEECNVAAAEEYAEQLLPSGVGIKKFSYYRQKSCLRVEVDAKVSNPAAIVDDFFQRTGLQLDIGQPGARSEEDSGFKPQLQPDSMEQNEAFRYVDQVFAEAGVRLFKKSRKQQGGVPYIELALITPEIGRRYQDLLQRLSEDTGWTVTISQNPNQQQLLRLARSLLRQHGFDLVKNPGVHTDSQTVKVKLTDVDADRLQTVAKEFFDQTGYQLALG